MERHAVFSLMFISNQKVAEAPACRAAREVWPTYPEGVGFLLGDFNIPEQKRDGQTQESKHSVNVTP